MSADSVPESPTPPLSDRQVQRGLRLNIVVESLRRREVFWGVGAIRHRLIWLVPAFVRAQSSITLTAVRELIEVQLGIFILCSWGEALWNPPADIRHRIHPMSLYPGHPPTP